MKAVRLALAAACVLGVALAAQAEDKKDDKKPAVGTKLVGKWEVTKTKGRLGVGSTVEFTKDGKVNIVHKADDAERTLSGTYKVDGDKLKVKIKVGDEEIEQTSTVTKVDDKTMETKNEEGDVSTFKRVKK